MKSVKIRSFFWSVFSRIRTEYGEVLRISPYSVRMREKTDQKKFHIWALFTQYHSISSAFRREKKKSNLVAGMGQFNPIPATSFYDVIIFHSRPPKSRLRVDTQVF